MSSREQVVFILDLSFLLAILVPARIEQGIHVDAVV
jgi:hypothetical protein